MPEPARFGRRRRRPGVRWGPSPPPASQGKEGAQWGRWVVGWGWRVECSFVHVLFGGLGRVSVVCPALAPARALLVSALAWGPAGGSVPSPPRLRFPWRVCRFSLFFSGFFGFSPCAGCAVCV